MDETPERAERCQSCRFWAGPCAGLHNANEEHESSQEKYGYCKRYPPRIFVPEFTSEMDGSTWMLAVNFLCPVMDSGDWCGEWRAKGTDVVPTDPVELLSGLDADSILARIKLLDRESAALKVLRRAAMRKKVK